MDSGSLECKIKSLLSEKHEDKVVNKHASIYRKMKTKVHNL